MRVINFKVTNIKKKKKSPTLNFKVNKNQVLNFKTKKRQVIDFKVHIAFELVGRWKMDGGWMRHEDSRVKS